MCVCVYVCVQISQFCGESSLYNDHVYSTGGVAWCHSNPTGLEQTLAGYLYIHVMLDHVYECVCVRERGQECVREEECVCVCVFMHTVIYIHL